MSMHSVEAFSLGGICVGHGVTWIEEYSLFKAEVLFITSYKCQSSD